MNNDSNDLPPIKPKKFMPKGGRPPAILSGDYKELFEACRKKKIDVFEECLKDIMGNDPKARSSAIKTAMDFLYTKRKAVEMVATIKVDERQIDETADSIVEMVTNGTATTILPEM
jgi:hypothetical protein